MTFITNNLYEFGGGERLAMETATRLSENFETTILNPVSSKDNAVIKKDFLEKSYDLRKVRVVDLAAFGIKVKSLGPEPYVMRFLKLSGFIKLVKVISNSDVVCQMSLNPAMLACSVFISRLLRKKFILGVHNFSVSKAIEDKGSIKSRISRLGLMLVLGRIKYFQVTNSRDLGMMRHYFPKATVREIPNFITRKSRKIKRNSKEFVCLYVGRLEKAKGVDLLCDAMERTLSKNRKVKFQIVGKKGGDQVSLVTAISKKYPKNVKWFEFVSGNELDNMYDDASLFLVTSRGEAFSLVTLEAQSSGLPVVSFDITGPKDILKNRFQGSLVKQFDTKEYSERILQYYRIWSAKKDYGNLKERINRYAYSTYSADAVMKQLESFFAANLRH
jgi:glycosyltransferase involved in cell wall biosynthesis